MAKIIESIVTKNRCYTGGRKITVRGLMLHSVGCPQQKAHVFVSTWNSQTAGVCPHGIIDGNDGIVYQTLPWDHRGWHGGSGSRGSGNNTHIGIEMCEPACIRYTSDSRFTCSDQLFPFSTPSDLQFQYNSESASPPDPTPAPPHNPAPHSQNRRFYATPLPYPPPAKALLW